ncbi:hypothetical protein LINPERPRIM_LOCUS5393 [Linum perenne]
MESLVEHLVKLKSSSD